MITASSNNLTMDLTDILFDGWLDWRVNPIHLNRGMYGHDALAITVNAMRRESCGSQKFVPREEFVVVLDEADMEKLLAAIVYYYGEHNKDSKFRELIEKELEYWVRE